MNSPPLSTSVMVGVVVLSLLITLALSQETDKDCSKHPDICSDSQCCLMMGMTEGECASLHMEDQMCEMTPQTHSSESGVVVYKSMCPCDKHFSCGESEDGMHNSVCQSDMDMGPESNDTMDDPNYLVVAEWD